MRLSGILLAPLAFVLGCAAEPIKTMDAELPVDAGMPPREKGSWALSGAVLTLDEGSLVLEAREGTRTLAVDVVGLPAISDDLQRVAYTRQSGDLGLSSIEVVEARGNRAWSEPRILADEGDRPALAPDGERLAFVSGRTGIASLWILPFEGGQAVQLTNRDLRSPAVSEAPLDGPVHPPGQAPPGFVPPPHQGPPRFEGDRLVWDGPDGPHEVALP